MLVTASYRGLEASALADSASRRVLVRQVGIRRVEDEHSEHERGGELLEHRDVRLELLEANSRMSWKEKWKH
ncbi:hypothetical protein GN244_ATG10329 [Phytophthora infestans]|uniref:Uncharacterized protein n=1 Tax=Phytophthora infestans TaxID=4787 RepID=A0A833WJ94_PHYIN|nr:hypothetical protein GN244_ATG10329 [Phytophthora infestans]KAF4140863.1 hypothetical protein GN958_ATG09711 [Phytophthora infestans]